MHRKSFEEDYEFEIYKTDDGGYSVSLPHQCGSWEIVGADIDDKKVDLEKMTDDYPNLPKDKELAIRQMRLFVKRAEEALERLINKDKIWTYLIKKKTNKMAKTLEQITDTFFFDAGTKEAPKHDYFLKKNGELKPLTGITTVLSVIAKPSLIPWAANMVADHIREHAEWQSIKFPEPQREYLVSESLLEEARKAHSKKKEEAAQKGTNIHAWISQWCLAEKKFGYPPFPEDEIAREQAEQFVAWAEKNQVKFLASEKKLMSEKLWIAGTLDFIAEIKGRKFMGDIKTYAKLYDRIPFLQMAGYRIMAEEMGEKDFMGSVVVNLPKGGELEEKYSYDDETDKKGFLAALELYRVLNNHK